MQSVAAWVYIHPATERRPSPPGAQGIRAPEQAVHRAPPPPGHLEAERITRLFSELA